MDVGVVSLLRPATPARMNRKCVGMSPRSARSDEAERADSSELDDLDDDYNFTDLRYSTGT